MLELIIGFSVFCFILLLILGRLDEKNDRLTAENGLIMGQIEMLQEQSASTERLSANEKGPLTLEGVEAAVRHAGYVPDTRDGWVYFLVAGERFFIDTTRLPLIIISRHYDINKSEWDMELLKKAAHLMSDDMIMVKAIFEETQDETSVRFIVATRDRNYHSFRDNLLDYLGIVRDGSRRMVGIYDRLVEEQKNETLTMTAIEPVIQQNPKLLS